MEAVEGIMETDEIQAKNEFEQLMATDTMVEDEFPEETPTKVVVQESKSEKECLIEKDQKDLLYKSLDVPIDESALKFGHWRLDVVHIRGVQDMSSEDVLEYFNEYNPNSLEWVNDLACNIVFDNETVAACVLRDLTTALVVKGNKYKEVSETDVDVIDGDTLDVAVPPGRWRLGKPNSKAKVLLLRIATEGDKKVKGAAKISQYYAKYGFPKSGLQSSESVASVKEFKKRVNIDENEVVPEVKTSKILRMRMRADDEEHNRETFKARSRLQVKIDPESAARTVTGEKESVWDRLDMSGSSRPKSSFGSRVVTSEFPFKRNTVWNRLHQKEKPSDAEDSDDLRSKINQRRERRSRVSDPY